MSKFTKAERRYLADIQRVMPTLRAADVVMACLPDGNGLLVKGRDRLDAIIATGMTKSRKIVYVPVPHAEAAAALDQVLGGDGLYQAPAVMGHA